MQHAPASRYRSWACATDQGSGTAPRHLRELNRAQLVVSLISYRGYRRAISAALMPMSDPFRRLSGRLPFPSRRMALVAGVAAIGAVALAAGLYIALEPDNGTPPNGAAVATHGATTGGRAATQSPTATATPTPTTTTATPGDDVRRRLLVKQGLTGLWQVSGRSDLSWEESVRLDLRYVEN